MPHIPNGSKALRSGFCNCLTRQLPLCSILVRELPTTPRLGLLRPVFDLSFKVLARNQRVLRITD